MKIHKIKLPSDYLSICGIAVRKMCGIPNDVVTTLDNRKVTCSNCIKIINKKEANNG